MEKEVSESDRRILIKKKYLGRIQLILNKPAIEDQEFFRIVKGFFSEFLKISYEFTYEELSAELNKVYIKPDIKKDIDDFLLNISEIEYLYDEELSQEKIRMLLEKIGNIINTLIVEGPRIIAKKETMLQKIFRKPKIEKKSTEQPVQEIPETMEKIDIDEIMSIKETVENPIEKNITQKIPYDEKQDSIIDMLNSQLRNQTNALLKLRDEKIEKTQDTKTKEIKQQPKKPSKQDAIIIEDNNPKIIRTYELIEEAYAKINTGETENAKNKYKQALESYTALNLEDKKEVYRVLHELYLRLEKI